MPKFQHVLTCAFSAADLKRHTVHSAYPVVPANLPALSTGLHLFPPTGPDILQHQQRPECFVPYSPQQRSPPAKILAKA